MDFFNRAASQLGDLFKSMTPGARVTAGMLLVMIIISLVYLFVFPSRQADRYLFGSKEFSDAEIATMQRAFGLENLDDYQLQGNRIRVPGGRLNEYMQALHKAGFSPEDIERDIEEIRERGSGFFESEKEKEFWRSQAQQQKLARAIRKRPEIAWATVQYREVKLRGFPPEVERSAAVVACGEGNRPLDRSTARSIRTLAGSWFAIRPEDVAVNDVNGDTLAAGEDVGGLSKEARMYADTKSYYDEYYRKQILQCLAFVGPGTYATVNVELDPTIANESTVVTVDPQTVAVNSETFEKRTENGPAQGGRPGAVPNQVAGNEPRTLATTNSQESTSDESHEQQSSITGHEQTRQRKAALVPTKVTATVSIPKSYFKKVVDGQLPEGTTLADLQPEVLSKELLEAENNVIRQIEDKVVKTLPPLAAGEDQYPRVEVSSYQDLPEALPQPPTISYTAWLWFSENWKTLGLFAIGLVSLFVLRSMLRSVTPKVTAAPAEEAIADTDATDEQSEEEEIPAILHRRSPATGLTLREELISMVREDPDAAANVLRNWIGDAA